MHDIQLIGQTFILWSQNSMFFFLLAQAFEFKFEFRFKWSSFRNMGRSKPAKENEMHRKRAILLCQRKQRLDENKTKNTPAVLQRTAVLSFRDAKLVKVLKKDYQRYSRTNRQEESFSCDLFDFLVCIDS